MFFFFFQAEDGIRDLIVTGVQTCALPISPIPPSIHHTETAPIPARSRETASPPPAAAPSQSHLHKARGSRSSLHTSRRSKDSHAESSPPESAENSGWSIADRSCKPPPAGCGCTLPGESDPSNPASDSGPAESS